MSEDTQRRLAAIVSADVVGYSRLMGMDETGTLERFRAHRAELVDALIAKHGGRIVKTMGDGLLLEFASVVNATKCALEIQGGMAERNADKPEVTRIAFRIGVNLGDIIIDGDDILGDGVNVAARLQEIAEPGGVAISRRVHEDVQDRLDALFEDAGEQALKNIARPVQVWRWKPDAGGGAAPSDALAGGSLPLPEKPSIAVLPFENMSGDPEQEYFSDGISEDIITELSRFADFHVIARNSSFAYKARAVDVRTVAKELGIQYVLEGSIRRAGQRVRITAQLIDGATGNHLWAERYDRDLEDIFDVQDEITRTIASTLGAKISEDGVARSIVENQGNASAYDLTLQAWAYFRRFSRSDHEKARQLAEQAKDLAPDFAGAYRILAWTYCFEAVQQWVEDIEGSLNHSYELARKAISLDDKAPGAHITLAVTEVNLGRHERALDNVQKAIKLNPSSADGYAFFGLVLTFAGRAEEGLAAIEKAMELNPHYPNWYGNLLGRAQFVLGNYEAAEMVYVDVLKSAPEAPAPRAGLAAALAAMGRLREARAEIEEVIRLNPNYTLRGVSKLHRFKNSKDLDHFLDALRQAGLPK